MDRDDKIYALGQYEKSMPSDLTWLEKLTLCKEFGFDYLEMSIDETDEKLARLDYTKKQREEILDAMSLSGVRIQSMCLSGHRKYPLGHPDVAMQKKALEIMEKAVQLACDLGIRIIQLAGYDVYYEEGTTQTREIFIENLAKAVYMAAEKGVLLGFETMETPFMDTVEKSMYYVEALNSPYLGVYPDIGNLKNASLLYGVSVDEDLEKGAGHIVASHLKETIPNHYREITFGTGHSEYTSNIEVLKQMGVRMFVGEFWYTGNKDWKEVCKHSASFLRDKLDAVFYE
ncbi:MAG: L-ribulose-5-phosphate 3-epimerase [Longicatena sp.]